MPRIEHLYAYVVADKNEDDEGVPAFMDSGGFWMPLMGADRMRADSIKHQAQLLANKSGKPIKLIRSTGIEIVEVINPDG